MAWRDFILAAGTLPLFGVLVMRLAAAMGAGITAPTPDALPFALVTFTAAFMLYVCMTIRAIACETREILERGLAESASRAARRPVAVTNFALHLDRRDDIDFAPSSDGETEDRHPPRATPERGILLGELRRRLADIPSVRNGS